DDAVGNGSGGGVRDRRGLAGGDAVSSGARCGGATGGEREPSKRAGTDSEPGKNRRANSHRHGAGANCAGPVGQDSGSRGNGGRTHGGGRKGVRRIHATRQRFGKGGVAAGDGEAATIG